MSFENPIFNSWYTDTMDILRIVNLKNESGASIQESVKINVTPIPCRIYSSSKNAPHLGNTTGITQDTEKVACHKNVEIKRGDKLMIIRGGVASGKEAERYYAGKPQIYNDPVGGIFSGLEHQEIPLLSKEINR